jgi:hypothetical protein
MSKANDYIIKVREEGVYLVKSVPSLEEKVQMSQDHRLLTNGEIIRAFYWFFTKYCRDHRTNNYRLKDGRKLLMEARRPRRPKTTKP